MRMYKIYNLKDYFDLKNLNRDSIIVLYDPRNPENSRIKKIKE